MSRTDEPHTRDTKLGFNATWSMAVGGMVGGGIFSTLRVVIGISGPWAWFSFLTAGLVALCTAYAYSKLSEDSQEAGGAFTFLRGADMPNLAGGLAWLLIAGYILTNASMRSHLDSIWATSWHSVPGLLGPPQWRSWHCSC